MRAIRVGLELPANLDQIKRLRFLGSGAAP